MLEAPRLIVLASQFDDAAWALAERWAAHGACVVTPTDLSTMGWRYRPGRSDASAATACERLVAMSEVRGVLVRLPWVYEHDIGHIVPADREYVAAEMSAFLLAWLSELPCKVVNRPAPGCLCGPAWRQEKWIHVAAGLGIPVAPMHRVTNHSSEVDAFKSRSPQTRVVTVIGGRCVGAANGDLEERARRLAAAAKTDFLAVSFDIGETPASPQFLAASYLPDVADSDVAAAVLAYFLGDEAI